MVRKRGGEQESYETGKKKKIFFYQKGPEQRIIGESTTGKREAGQYSGGSFLQLNKGLRVGEGEKKRRPGETGRKEGELFIKEGPTYSL